MHPNAITREIIGAAIRVHRELGPDKPEGAYEQALSMELTRRGISHRIQRPVPVVYQGVKLECGYRLDILVSDTVVIEVKSVEQILPVHRAQVLTYLRLGQWRLALLLNFNVAVLKDGIHRLVLGLKDGEIETAETPRTQRKTPSKPKSDVREESQLDQLAHHIVQSALEVHRELGPGLLQSTYEVCLCHELHLRGLGFQRKVQVPLSYLGQALPASDEVDLLVGGRIAVASRALEVIAPVHAAGLLSQLRQGNFPLGLLINFNSVRLADAIQRLANSAAAHES
jgi:GxxExxY protein